MQRSCARFRSAHRDPFDLLLIAQALVDELSVATVDPVFRAHGVDVVW